MSLPRLAPVAPLYRRRASRACPLRLFAELYPSQTHAFLYESLEERGTRGRYSFLGARPRALFKARRDRIELHRDGGVERCTGNPLDVLRELLHTQEDIPPVAPFCGGAVGYLSYDAVRWCEKLPDRTPDDPAAWDAFFLFPTEILCFDHLEQVVHILLYQSGPAARRRLAEIDAVLGAAPDDEPAVPAGPADAQLPEPPHLQSNMTAEQFEQRVRRAKEYILAGDVFQVVLSQRFEFSLRVEPLALYQALRRTNPSPYMYYLRLDDLHIAGSSPEILARVVGRNVATRPLAGTRPRGRTPQEDAALAAELRADPKEQAEHVMLVDLGRNDLGRVCEFGSVKVTELLEIERHSKVMHLVSNVQGWLAPQRDALDVFRAVFPAGTVSGAPKVRAMEIIEELEPVKRGVYAGAIGYFSLMGDMDLCIAIRTIVMTQGRGFIQAGAGIVADSVPELEYRETLNKAGALLRAVQVAEASES